MIRRIVIAAAVLAGGCQSARYGHLRIQENAGETDYATVSDSGVTLREGAVVIINAEPIAASGPEYVGLEQFEIESDDDSITKIRRGVLRDSFVMTGELVGNTYLNVFVDEEMVEQLPVEIYDGGAL